MKRKTNRDLIMKCLNELDEIDIAVMRERLVQAVENVVNNESDVRKQFKDNAFMTADCWLNANKRIYNIIKFDNL